MQRSTVPINQIKVLKQKSENITQAQSKPKISFANSSDEDSNKSDALKKLASLGKSSVGGFNKNPSFFKNQLQQPILKPLKEQEKESETSSIYTESITEDSDED